MAGSQIAVPVNGASDWSDFVTFTERIARGYMGVSLTEYDTTAEPQIAAGSAVEVGGALYQFGTLESITGWSGISNDSDAYIKVVPSGSSITAVFTTTAPTWSTSKQGWYDSNDRYITALYRDGVGDYTLKRMMSLADLGIADQTDGILEGGAAAATLKTKKIELGDWDMQATAQLNVAHGLDWTTIRYVMGMIRFDAGSNKLRQFGDVGGYIDISTTNIELARTGGGLFDQSVFNDTSYNRGWITIWYEA